MTRSRLWAGTVLLALGGLLLAEQLGEVTAWEVLADWWPVAIILLGVAQLVTRPRNVVGGVTVALVGGVVLLWTLGLLTSIALLWPLLLVALGLWLLLRRPGASSDGVRLDEVVAVFDDRVVRARSGLFAGGSVTTVFGDVDVDLSRATIETRATLALTTVFGDVDLTIPAHWRVTVAGPELFGDVAAPDEPTAPRDLALPTLHLQVVTVFGDVTVRRERPPARYEGTAAGGTTRP